MASVGNLDFGGYVRAKQEQRAKESQAGGRDDDHAYAYAADRQTRAAFAKIKPVEMAVAAGVRILKQMGRSELLGTAVKVGPQQFPRVHDLTVRAAETLGIATPTVYIRNNPVMNAATYGTNESSFIMVHSGLIDHFSDEELLSVLGHECGHIHNDHVVFLTAMHYLRMLTERVLGWAWMPAYLALQGWSRRAEITCDRAGALCCGDVEISTRALAKLALGSTKLYDELNLEVYLQQYEEGQETAGKFTEVFASHPWLPKRVKALRVFERSNLYRQHSGAEGDGSLTMDQVDEQVHEIVRVT